MSTEPWVNIKVTKETRKRLFALRHETKRRQYGFTKERVEFVIVRALDALEREQLSENPNDYRRHLKELKTQNEALIKVLETLSKDSLTILESETFPKDDDESSARG
jgi:predicted Zn-dependent peptidase